VYFRSQFIQNAVVQLNQLSNENQRLYLLQIPNSITTNTKQHIPVFRQQQFHHQQTATIPICTTSYFIKKIKWKRFNSFSWC